VPDAQKDPFSTFTNCHFCLTASTRKEEEGKKREFWRAGGHGKITGGKGRGKRWLSFICDRHSVLIQGEGKGRKRRKGCHTKEQNKRLTIPLIIFFSEDREEGKGEKMMPSRNS